MKVIRKMMAFSRLPLSRKVLLLEAFFMLGWARILKLLPFSRVAPSLGVHMEETEVHQKSNIKTLKQVSEAIHIMSRYTFWESECLVKAIAGMRMLQRRKIESTLYLGTGRDEDGQLIAHAWLRSGPYYISGSEGMERFAVVAKFAKRIQEHNIFGENNGYSNKN